MNRISLFKTRIVIEDKVYLLAKDVRKALGYKSIEQLHGEYPEIVKHVKDLPALVLESDFNMEQIYPLYKETDVVVLASPLYYWFISGFLKNAFDRLFAIAECDSNYRNPKKLCFRRTGWKGLECRCGSFIMFGGGWSFVSGQQLRIPLLTIPLICLERRMAANFVMKG